MCHSLNDGRDRDHDRDVNNYDVYKHLHFSMVNLLYLHFTFWPIVLNFPF